jgi:hypothetical protein
VKLGAVLAHLLTLEGALAGELRAAAERHRDEHDVFHQCRAFARNADARAARLEPLARSRAGVDGWRSALDGGGVELLEELRALDLRLHEVALTWTMAEQAAKALRDAELLACASESGAEATGDAAWLVTRIKTAAPQALTVG